MTIEFTPEQLAALDALPRHASLFELSGALHWDEEADTVKDRDAYDRRVLLVSLQSALARIVELEGENKVFRANSDEDTPGPWIQRAFDALAVAQGNADVVVRLTAAAEALADHHEAERVSGNTHPDPQRCEFVERTRTTLSQSTLKEIPT